MGKNFWQIVKIAGQSDQRIIQIATWLHRQGLKPNQHILPVFACPIRWRRFFWAILWLGAVPVAANFRDTFHFDLILKEMDIPVCTDDPEMAHNHTWFFDNQLPTKDFSKQILPKNNKELLFLYTSGSSGFPKRITKTHDNMAVEVHFLKKLLQLNSDDKILSLVPPYHIYGLIFGVILPVLANCKVYDHNSWLPEETTRYAHENKITIMIATPLHYLHIEQATYLRLALSSGFAMPEETAWKFLQKSRAPILDLYGSTESGGIAYRFWNKGENIPSFRRFAHVEILQSDKPCEELLVYSPSVASNVLLKDEKWYATGDIVQWTDDNQFKVIARKSNMIKSGGRRISAGQLEEEIKLIAQVADAAVVRIESSSARGEQALAFVELKQGINITAMELMQKWKKSANRRIIKKIIIGKIPRYSNGKKAYPVLCNTIDEEKL